MPTIMIEVEVPEGYTVTKQSEVYLDVADCGMHDDNRARVHGTVVCKPKRFKFENNGEYWTYDMNLAEAVPLVNNSVAWIHEQNYAEKNSFATRSEALMFGAKVCSRLEKLNKNVVDAINNCSKERFRIIDGNLKTTSPYIMLFVESISYEKGRKVSDIAAAVHKAVGIKNLRVLIRDEHGLNIKYDRK